VSEANVMRPPGADQARRGVKATLLGLALGIVLLALARRARDR
jgi:hypothetical protein